MIRELLHQISRVFTWLVLVAPWEQALRVRLGKRVRLLRAGVYLRVPFIDRVYRQSIRRRLSLVGMQTVTTADRHTITIAGVVGYSIADLLKLYNTLSHAEDTIVAQVGGAVAKHVAAHPLAECGPGAIEAAVRSVLKLDRYGLADPEFFVNQYAVVRTYRLIQDQARDWLRGDSLDTDRHDGTPPER